MNDTILNESKRHGNNRNISVIHSRRVDHRAESPTPSLLSVKSDRSINHPPHFSNEPGPSHTQYVTPPTQYTQYNTVQYTQYNTVHYTHYSTVQYTHYNTVQYTHY